MAELTLKPELSRLLINKKKEEGLESCIHVVAFVQQKQYNTIQNKSE